MDSPWRPGDYTPSSACEVAPYEPLEPERLAVETADLSTFTQKIVGQPYDPEAWLYRSRTLRLLGFPELALGDAYKARLLVEAGLARTEGLGKKTYDLFEEKIRKLYSSNPKWRALVATSELLEVRSMEVLNQLEIQVWTELMEGLMSANACQDYLELSREAVQKFPGDAVFPSEVANAESWLKQREVILQTQLDDGDISTEQMNSTLSNGGVYPTAYPWMTDDLTTRDDELFQLLGIEFGISSTNCTVSRSTVRDVSTDESEIVESDVFGVVATTNIEAGAAVLSDATVAGVTSSNKRCASCCGDVTENFTNTCCTIGYCSSECSQTAIETFHPVLCGKDLEFLFEDAKSAESTTSFSLDSILLLRVLAIAIHENASQPLKTALLNRLTPAYKMDHLIIFNLKAHIITPILTLQALSVDVFSNTLYDTWVLHTIRCRLQNNKHGQILGGNFGTAVNPLYSMFNHSCDPNIGWEHTDENSTLTCFARRDVKEGEELFISYIGYEEMEYDERQSRLAPWLGRVCGCTKCQRDRWEE